MYKRYFSKNILNIKLLINLFILFCCINLSKSYKIVSSSLDANWTQTSFLAETSEFVANTISNGNLFWNFVEELFNEKYFLEQNSDEKEFNLALKIAENLLPDGQSGISLLRLSLSLRLYSARIQLHRQIANDLLPKLKEIKCSENNPFYEINGIVSCKYSEIDKLLQNANEREPSQIYSIDHLYPNNFPDVNNYKFPLIVLYANIGQPNLFQQFHKEFVKMSNNGLIKYVFRHFDKKTVSTPLVSLSGYGVELAVKSTEYKALDDLAFVNNGNENIGEQSNQNDLEILTPLERDELEDIGFQASQNIMNNSPENVISSLIDLSQNFPSKSRSLTKIKVSQSFREEILFNQNHWNKELELSEGESALWINGINIGHDLDSVDLFHLFETLRQEQLLANYFKQIGFKREYFNVLQTMDLSEEKSNTWALDFRDGDPHWINNLDKDQQYSDWGNSVRLLLQPYFPGMIRPIARNLFSLVCILNPSSPSSRDLLKTTFSLYMHQVPLRIGFIFVINDKLSLDGKSNVDVALFNIFEFIKEKKGTLKAIHFIQKIHEELSSPIEVSEVHKFFKGHYPDSDFDKIFGLNSEYNKNISVGINFYRRSGLRKLPTVLVNGIPLDNSALESSDRIEDGILFSIMRQTSSFQRAVIDGSLTDKENILNWVMSRPDVLPRLNPRLIGNNDEDNNERKILQTFISASNDDVSCEDNVLLDKMSSQNRFNCLIKERRYLVRSDEMLDDDNSIHWFTVWLVADLNSAKGQQLFRDALKSLKKSNYMRLSLIYNGPEIKKNSWTIAHIFDSILTRLSSAPAKRALNKLLGLEEIEKMGEKIFDENSIEKLLNEIGGHGINMDPILAELKSGNVERRLALQSSFAFNDLNLIKGQIAVIINSKVFGPFDNDEDFGFDDFVLAERLAERKGVKKVAEMVKGWKKHEKKVKNPSDTLLQIISFVENFAIQKRRHSVDIGMEFESVLNLLAKDDDRPIFQIVAIINPISRVAQKLAPILQILLKVLNVDLTLAMNPRTKIAELPLKRYYRYVLLDTPTFDQNGQLLPNFAHFEGLPHKQLLTLNLDVPEAWMVQPIWSDHDLDNIRLALVQKEVIALFQLRHILLEGHCFDEQSGNPPRGLQFVLGTRTNIAMFDTIVMANLGYFQLKAGPGAWILRLREGRSKEIYEIKGSVGAEKTTKKLENNADGELEELHVLVDSFTGKTIRMRVAKRTGMEKRNLLSEENEKGSNASEQPERDEEDDDDEGSIWSNFAPKKVVENLSNKLLGGEKYDVINIFSLASGHLYERFLRIMMLSESLPLLGKHYGFDYQLIEYKWPRWLHQQIEKQRVMWGYKILFLDVLFPLDVKKIIFVDADQVVRADMMELMELDLHGAPYGYTPFCDSRTSMGGFRFWKSGYWASHLAGRKYHISALYVVDLLKFRQIAAGDRLRGQYQGLSADPNSLSNLDQDLPNNMIHQVRIHSLPQEWLWCETWCDDSSKVNAKTVDLCNNPQTKEPKLESAMRIIPEWTELDNEIKEVLISRIDDKNEKNEIIDEDKHKEL
uniref:UDP-glucose:glycoprotein glucosyltransferase n=1 Tax=Meloidogyne hapla TaxID=6305 RepID=A0A1I8B9P0_MELHA